MSAPTPAFEAEHLYYFSVHMLRPPLWIFLVKAHRYVVSPRCHLTRPSAGQLAMCAAATSPPLQQSANCTVMLQLQSEAAMLLVQPTAAIARLGATDQAIISAVSSMCRPVPEDNAKQNHCIENSGRFNWENVFAQ